MYFQKLFLSKEWLWTHICPLEENFEQLVCQSMEIYGQSYEHQ